MAATKEATTPAEEETCGNRGAVQFLPSEPTNCPSVVAGEMRMKKVTPRVTLTIQSVAGVATTIGQCAHLLVCKEVLRLVCAQLHINRSASLTAACA